MTDCVWLLRAKRELRWRRPAREARELEVLGSHTQEAVCRGMKRPAAYVLTQSHFHPGNSDHLGLGLDQTPSDQPHTHSHTHTQQGLCQSLHISQLKWFHCVMATMPTAETQRCCHTLIIRPYPWTQNLQISALNIMQREFPRQYGTGSR